MILISLISYAFHLRYLSLYFTVVVYPVSLFLLSHSFLIVSVFFSPFSFSLAFEKCQCLFLVHSLGLSTFHHMENVKHAVRSCFSSYLFPG